MNKGSEIVTFRKYASTLHNLFRKLFKQRGRALKRELLYNVISDMKKLRSGTHILRHGMATLARKVGGGLDAVIAMTGHKDYKLADHYSKLDTEYQKELSEKIMRFIDTKRSNQLDTDNVLEFAKYSSMD